MVTLLKSVKCHLNKMKTKLPRHYSKLVDDTPRWPTYPPALTHWGRVTHIYVGNLTIIRPVNGLSPDRCQAVVWTNAGILLVGPWGTTFSEILIGIHTLTLKTIHFKMSSAKWHPFSLCLNVLIYNSYLHPHNNMGCTYPPRYVKFRGPYALGMAGTFSSPPETAR